MKRLISFLTLVALCIAGFSQNKVSTIDSSENVVTATVAPTANIAKVPIIISMNNPNVPMTCLQCYIEPPCEQNRFYQTADSSIVYVPSPRWGAQHQPMFAQKPKKHPNSLMVMPVSTSSSNFTGTEGPIITVYFDASSLADGDYTVKIKDINMVWTDKRSIVTYLSPDYEAPFTVKNKTILAK